MLEETIQYWRDWIRTNASQPGELFEGPWRDLVKGFDIQCLLIKKVADVFVLPSQRERFGITALEALACGTPVVTIAHPQNAAQELVIDGQTGAICDQSSEALAQGIRRAQTTVREVDCKDYAAAYEWDTIAKRAEKLYQTVV